jgi:hypothetical protein
LVHVYERIVDVMRALQKDELESGRVHESGQQQTDSAGRKVSRSGETGKQS